MALEKDINLLENLDKIFLLKNVEVIAVKDIDPEKLNIDIGYKKKGTRFFVSLERARKLLRDGYVTIPQEYFNWLKKVLWKEKSKASRDILVKHEDNFYERLFILIEAFKYDKNFANIGDEYRRSILHLIRQTLINRLEIILKYAVDNKENILDNTAPEESLLLRIIGEVIDTWMRKLGLTNI